MLKMYISNNDWHKLSYFIFILFTFIQQWCIILIKHDSKDIYNAPKNLFKINAVLLDFQFVKK